jgi:aminoglycoside/choline kinase family phosphotransferase
MTQPVEIFSESPLARLQKFLSLRFGENYGEIQPLTPDASTREYLRVKWNDLTAIACVYPESFTPESQSYLDVTNLFLAAGLPVAKIYNFDGSLGVIILEDFGDNILRPVLETASETEREKLLEQGIKLIANIQAATPLAFESNSIASRLAFDFEKLSWELDFFTKHYFESYRGETLPESEGKELKNELDEVARELETRISVLCHRDFHAANLMIDAGGNLRIIDHQDARMGAASYDLVSLLLDRILEPPSEQWLNQKQAFFLAEREKLGLPAIGAEQYAYEFRLQTIQRCLKAIGTFSFQTAVRGKTGYSQYIKPMFEAVLQAAEKLNRFPVLQRTIKENRLRDSISVEEMRKRAMKFEFKAKLSEFVKQLNSYISADNNQWTVKGFIDVFQNIYTISADTKIVSKILEIHLFPKILEFAQANRLKVVLTKHQNYYPDISFVSLDDDQIKFAVDFKTTYRLPLFPEFCNGFTLGSHGEYFINRDSSKNIQFPYREYLGHFCLGIIYSRSDLSDIDETKIYRIDQLQSITSVISDFQFFVCEKWEIASDSSGSGNTANIGSINKISDILNCNGMFKNLGEEIFDDYWMNYGKITTIDKNGKPLKITKLRDFLEYRGLDPNLINPRASRKRR